MREEKDDPPFPYRLEPGENLIGSYHPLKAALKKISRKKFMANLVVWLIFFLPIAAVLVTGIGAPQELIYAISPFVLIPMTIQAITEFYMERISFKKTYWLSNRRAFIINSPHSRKNQEILLDQVSIPLLVMDNERTGYKTMTVFFAKKGMINPMGLDPLQPLKLVDIFRFYRKDAEAHSRRSLLAFGRLYRKQAFTLLGEEDAQKIVAEVVGIIRGTNPV